MSSADNGGGGGGGGGGAGGENRYQHVRIQALVDRYRALQSSSEAKLSEMQEELSKATGMLQKLRSSLLSQSKGDGPRVQVTYQALLVGRSLVPTRPLVPTPPLLPL
jgi:hypothetical protein